MTSHPNQIIIGSSTEQLINLLTDILDDQSFIIEQPSYPPIKQVLDKKQIPYLQVPVTPTGIDIDAFKQSKHHVAYVTPSHQFPTGYVMNLDPTVRWLKKMTIVILLKMIMILSFVFPGNLFRPYKV